MQNPVVGTWLNISEGCPMRYRVSGSNLAHLMLGDNELELAFDAASLREFVKLGTAALAETDARLEREDRQRARLDQAVGRSA